VTVDQIARNREVEALLGAHPGDIAAVYLRRGTPPLWARELRARVDARIVELVDEMGIPRTQIAEALGWPPTAIRGGRGRRYPVMDEAIYRGRRAKAKASG